MTNSVLVLTLRQMAEYRKLMDPLPEILDDIVLEWPGRRLYLTDIHRTEDENPLGAGMIHVVGPPYRAVDVGTTSVGDTPGSRWRVVEHVGEKINERWIYDPQRPDKKVVVVQRHGTAPHLHAQVHPRTRRRA